MSEEHEIVRSGWVKTLLGLLALAGFGFGSYAVWSAFSKELWAVAPFLAYCFLGMALCFFGMSFALLLARRSRIQWSQVGVKPHRAYSFRSNDVLLWTDLTGIQSTLLGPALYFQDQKKFVLHWSFKNRAPFLQFAQDKLNA